MNEQQMVNNLLEDPIQREIEKLEESNKKQEEKLQNQETRATQNLNLYFIFQAVILASTTMASATKCHQWWIPFAVSLLAAIINFFNFSITMFKVVKSREDLDQNLADVAFIKLNRMTRAQVNQVQPGARLNQPQGNDELVIRPKARAIRRWKCRLQVYVSMGVFVVFTAVIMVGCYTTLCHSDDRKCVKLC